jgi:hypothetical protein
MMWLKNRGAAFETRAIALEDTQTYTALRSIYRSHIKASLLNLASGIARAALERSPCTFFMCKEYIAHAVSSWS